MEIKLIYSPTAYDYTFKIFEEQVAFNIDYKWRITMGLSKTRININQGKNLEANFEESRILVTSSSNNPQEKHRFHITKKK